MKRYKKNTDGFEHLRKHLVALNDHLKLHDSFVALSSSHDYFKIKNSATDDADIAVVDEMILNWAKKYRAKIERVDGKHTYYLKSFDY